MNPRTARLSLIFPALAAATLVGQAPQQETPTFRSAVKLIDVDVVVTDSQGNAVRGLAVDDFEIVEEGRSQTIQAFSFMNLPIRPHPTSVSGELEPDVTANRMSDGRTYVLVLDDPGSEDLILRTKHIARKFIDDVVQVDDQVAVVHAHGTFNDAQSFTTSKRLMLGSIDKLRRRPTSREGLNVDIVQGLDVLRTLRDVSERLGTLTGRRKAVIWVGANIDFHPHSRMTVGAPTPAEVFQLPVLLDAYQELVQAAASSNVAVYPLDARGLTTDLGMTELTRIESLREVAADTGGLPLGVNSNNYGDAFAAVVRDASTYYLLGYSPDRQHDDGKFHSITVRVKRPGVTVRARRGYYAPDPAKEAARKPLPPLPAGLSVAAGDALRGILPVRGLGLDVATTPFKGIGREHTVAITAHARGADVQLDGTRTLSVAYQVFDTEGKIIVGNYKVLKLELTQATRSAVERSGFRFTERVNLAPGRYELRLVVEQPGGSLGSVLAPLEVPEYKGALTMSGVALASRDAATEVSLVDGTGLRDALGVSQTARRRFKASEGLAAFAEVYADDPLAITMAGTIATPSGSVVTRAEGQVVVPTQPDDRQRRAFRATFRLPTKPGDYVLTLEAQERDRGRPIRRQIPIAVE